MHAAGHRFWVAESRSAAQVAGFVYAIIQEEAETTWRYGTTVVTLDQMGVARAWQQQGVGRALVRVVADAAAEVGAPEVRLNVWSFNEGAWAFHARCGFRQVQQRLWLPIDPSGDVFDGDRSAVT
jgi:GNAT superfamily N-acetyltransferase